MDKNLEAIKEIVKNGENIVVLSGIEVMRETGLNGVSAEHIAYDIEQEYGYSNDEIVSSLFFSRRVDIFYKYYKEIILNKEIAPTAVHRGVAKLEEEGRLDAVVTRMVYSMYQKAGCEKVIELHGSVEKNVCPVCGRTYGAGYIKKAVGIPECEICNVPLRPGFVLYGEMVDNGKITKASYAVENANILLIIGSAINSSLCRYIIKYYGGSKMILLNTVETPGDDAANYRAYGNLSEMVSEIMDY